VAARIGSFSGVYGPCIFVPDINPVGGSVVRELILKMPGNKFPPIRVHQSESQLYKSDTFLTKHSVLQYKNESPT
jgi:hypothetical protein